MLFIIPHIRPDPPDAATVLLMKWIQDLALPVMSIEGGTYLHPENPSRSDKTSYFISSCLDVNE